jgi:hypothetical protein
MAGAVIMLDVGGTGAGKPKLERLTHNLGGRKTTNLGLE